MSQAFLRQLPLFSGLSDEDLGHLCEMAETVELAAGQVLIQEGEPGDALYIALEGKFEITKRSHERDLVIASRGPGDILGETSLLEQTPRTATVRAVEDSRLLKISREAFEHLLSQSGKAALAVLRTVTARLRNTEAMLRQSEKMAALGTLAAGLAHELNNPAAAAQRSAGQLRENLAELQRLEAEMARLALRPDAIEMVNGLRRELPHRVAAPARLDPLVLRDREDLVAGWMDEQGLETAWELASPVVALGWTPPDLEALSTALTPAQRPIFIRWLATACTVYALLDEVGQAAGRIAEIVRAVRSYAYLDRAPVQVVDVHEGLEDTLVILRHKLKQGVTVIKEYAADLPRIEAYASELNQVWTNIIDNAIDAMSGHGVIRIRTFAEEKPLDGGHRQAIVVEIADNGPGIPPEIQSRIFDAFFTTKPVGAGNGLGLHITYNIVVHQHHGAITVQSTPGETRFRVTLPVELDR